MVRRALIVLTAVIALAVCAGPASARPLRWSQVNQIDYGGNTLGSIACVGDADCIALDVEGRVVRLELHSSAPGHPPQGVFPVLLNMPGRPTAIACPDNECTAVTDSGNETTFDLDSPAASAHADRVDPAATDASAPATPGLACPSSTECVIGDDAGNVVTFSPAEPGAAMRTGLDPGTGLVAVACPSTAQCTAISATRQWTFDPSDPATNTTSTIESGTGRAAALACPTTTQCSSVDASGRETTFDPESSAPATPAVISTDPRATDDSVVCPTTTLCTAADRNGSLDSFDPQTGAAISHPTVGDPVDLACLSATECVLDTSRGDERLFTPGQAPSYSSQIPVDAGFPFVAVSCPSATRCVSVTSQYEAGFNPNGNGFGNSENLLLAVSSAPTTGVGCPTTTLCSAVSGNGEVEFNPASYNATARYRGLNSPGALTAVRCPAAAECVAIDSAGMAVTYAPVSGHVLRSNIVVDAHRTLTALFCSSSTQCTATDNDGSATTFDPLSGRRLASLTVDPGIGLDTGAGFFEQELDGIGCHGTRTCVAVDSRGDIISFDPLSRRRIHRQHVDNLGALTGVACPTSGQCELTDTDGRVFSGRPYGSRWTPTRFNQVAALDAITCRSATQCVAVDAAGAEYTSH